MTTKTDQSLETVFDAYIVDENDRCNLESSIHISAFKDALTRPNKELEAKLHPILHDVLQKDLENILGPLIKRKIKSYLTKSVLEKCLKAQIKLYFNAKLHEYVQNIIYKELNAVVGDELVAMLNRMKDEHN